MFASIGDVAGMIGLVGSFVWSLFNRGVTLEAA